MAHWTEFPHVDDYPFDAAGVKKSWAKLHAGDQEALPSTAKVLDAWVLFHRGEFQKAFQAGLKAGPAGVTVANKAQCIYANYLEPKEKVRQDHFQEVVKRASEQVANEPQNANAHYWHAYALGRYSQGISVAKALAQGLGGKIKTSLETTIRLQPAHADAHIALAMFHAEVIDKVGALIGSMTYGAKKATSLALFEQALRLTPKAPAALIEYANALVMFEGDRRMEEATSLYGQAAGMRALDALQRLDVELALAELAD